jgi:hypothetical protein
MLPSVINALRLADEPAPDVPAQVPEVAHPAQVGGTGGTPSPAQVAQPDGPASRSSLSGIRVSGIRVSGIRVSGIRVSGIRVSLRSIERELNAAGVPTPFGTGYWGHQMVARVLARSGIDPRSSKNLANSMTWRVRDSGSLAE